MLGLALAVLCGVGWAVMDALRKRLAAKLSTLPLLVLLTAGQLPIFGAWWLGRWWLDQGSAAQIDPGGYLLPALSCAAANVLASWAFIKALERSPLGKTIPFLAFTPVFSALSALLLLQEAPQPAQLLGIALVVLGGVLLGFEQWRGGFELGSALMLGVALLWSLTGALDKMALQHAPVSAHALIQTLLLLLVFSAALLMRADASGLSKARPVRWLFALTVLVAALTSGIQYWALLLSPVSVVEAIKRAIGGFAAVLVGWRVFGEELRSSRLLAVALMSAGTALLLLGIG